MNKPMIADELWRRLEPLLSQAKARREKYPGRKPVPDRAALNGIAFVLHTALRWRDLPAEMGCGSGVTCWRRLRDWQEAGVWDRLHEVLLGKLRAAGQIDLSRVVVDSPSVRAIGAGTKTGHPVYRARPGSKHHVATDANGVPLSISLTGANRHDVTQLLPLIDAIPAIRSIRGRPLQMPQVVLADRGYDSESHRQKLLDRGIKPVLAKRRTEHGSGLGTYRWVIERTHAWFHNFHRLRIRYERPAKIHEAFLKFAACLICWNTLQRSISAF